MKNISKQAQTFFESLIIFALLAIIAVGIYKLAMNWTQKDTPKQPVKAHKVIEGPSKELCSFMMKQCQGKLDK